MVRRTDEIRAEARAALSDEQFPLFEFYMKVYQSLCPPENKELASIDAWCNVMTFLEEQMHELYPPVTVISRGILPPYAETENHGRQQVPSDPA